MILFQAGGILGSSKRILRFSRGRNTVFTLCRTSNLSTETKYYMIEFRNKGEWRPDYFPIAFHMG